MTTEYLFTHQLRNETGDPAVALDRGIITDHEYQLYSQRVAHLIGGVRMSDEFNEKTHKIYVKLFNFFMRDEVEYDQFVKFCQQKSDCLAVCCFDEYRRGGRFYYTETDRVHVDFVPEPQPWEVPQ